MIQSKEQQAVSIAAVLVMAENGLCQGSRERLQRIMDQLCVNSQISIYDVEVLKGLMENSNEKA